MRELVVLNILTRGVSVVLRFRALVIFFVALKSSLHLFLKPTNSRKENPSSLFSIPTPALCFRCF